MYVTGYAYQNLPATSIAQTSTVSPSPLTVTTTSISPAYGAANPTFSCCRTMRRTHMIR
jgi:hypothetical protein